MRRPLAALALTLTLACHGGEATRYSGSAMNDALPEKEGTIQLTLFSRSDTAFQGVVEVGAPLSGTGSAYAWNEGSDFKIVTVAASGGDTIVWTSKHTEAGLGGRFEITGGEHAGQGGTWRARLVSGPPATEATLRRPMGFPTAPLTALWPALVLALILAAAARWVGATPLPVVRDVTEPASAVRAPAGISGWLALFVLGQGMAVIVALFGLTKLMEETRAGLAVGAVVSGMSALLVLEGAMRLLTPILGIVGLILTVRRDRRVPRFWFGYLALLIGYVAIDLIMMVQIRLELDRLIGSSYADVAERQSTRSEMLRRIFFTSVWLLYWTRSKRVRATFGLAALDRTAQPVELFPPMMEAIPPLSPPGPGRGRRIALRIGAGLGIGVAFLAALAGIGLWSARVSPYALPAGADIRKTVAGRWDWTTHAATCTDSAHVIAFPGDGKTMTITSQFPIVDSLGRDHTVSTYDIRLSTPSFIRGAIRGETRMTSAGTPVVWDLVLVGPDEYRWRRTDWSTPWGYTGSIVRCPAMPVASPPSAPRRGAGAG
jgi:hypothetical protein